MQIKEAKFVKSSQKTDQCPKPDKPEYAFIGRSNVGKSSLINMLTGRKKLAKISGTPGKTQLVNHFLINDSWYLVDLPGYGYAKVSKSQRKSFGKLIESYIHTRENLMNLFVLIDSRIPLQKRDLDFMISLGEKQIPFSIVYTKTDKLKKTT
jgi:GTP-binding protein